MQIGKKKGHTHIPTRNGKPRRKGKKHRLDNRPQHAHDVCNIPEHSWNPEDSFRGEIVRASPAEEEEESWDGEGDLGDDDGRAYECVEGC